jgi:hypothetical protein
MKKRKSSPKKSTEIHQKKGRFMATEAFFCRRMILKYFYFLASLQPISPPRS